MKINVKNEYLVLGIVLMIGTGLRFYNLEEESLWNDELSTWKRTSQESISEVIRLAAETDIHPPGYQVFMFGWMSVFGDSEFSLRFPSALAGIVSVFLMFLLAKREYGSIAGLTVSWMVAISWYPIHFSQEARAYALMMMLVLWVLCQMENISKASWSAKTSFTLSLIVLAYLHYFGSYFVGLLLILQLAHSENRRFWLIVSTMIFISAIPWIPSALSQGNDGPVYIQPHSFLDVFRWIRYVFSESNLFSILIVGSVLAELIKSKHRFGIMRPLSWIAMIWVPTWILSEVWVPILTFPNMIIALPFVLLVFSGALHGVDQSGKVMILVAVVYSVIAANFLVIEKDYYHTPQKQQFRESVEFVVRENQDEAFPIYGWVSDVDYLRYYSKGINGSSFEILPRVEEMKTNTSFWLLEAHRILPDSLHLALTMDYQVHIDTHFVGARVRKYTLK